MKLLTLLAWSVAMPSVVMAQQPTLTIHEAIRRSVQQHPSVSLAQANAERGDHAVREILATRMPQLSIESNVTRFQEPMVVAPLHGFDPRQPPVFDRTLAQGSITLGYTLFDAARGDRITRARALADAAEASVDVMRAMAISETVRAYLRVQSARDVLTAQQKRQSALERERDRARQLVEQGRAARVVLLRAEAAVSAARAETITAQSDIEGAEHDLARLVGVPVAVIRQTRVAAVRLGDAALPGRDTLAANAVAQNGDLIRLQYQRAAADAEQKAARGSRLPRVQLGGRFIEYASSATSPQGEWQGGAQLSYPVFTGGSRSAAADRAAAEARAAEAELMVGQRRVDENIDRALTVLAGARARVTALEAAVAQSEEVTRIDRLALDAGAGVQSDYLTAEADLFRARAALTSARADEIMSRVELARVSGQLTEEWTTANLGAVR